MVLEQFGCIPSGKWGFAISGRVAGLEQPMLTADTPNLSLLRAREQGGCLEKENSLLKRITCLLWVRFIRLESPSV